MHFMAQLSLSLSPFPLSLSLHIFTDFHLLTLTDAQRRPLAHPHHSTTRQSSLETARGKRQTLHTLPCCQRGRGGKGKFGLAARHFVVSRRATLIVFMVFAN